MDDGAWARIDLKPLEQFVGYNIHILDLKLYQLFYADFSARAVTPGMFSALLAIHRNPGIRHGALADALMVQRPNMTTLTNRLEREGYLQRRDAPGDKRSVALTLSAKGERAVEEMLAVMAAHDERATDGLSAKERKTLLALLRKLADRLCERPVTPA